MPPDVYCRHCGVRLRRAFGRWFHVKRLGPLACPGAEPDPDPGPEPDPEHDPES
jgi:hypothetical protein